MKFIFYKVAVAGTDFTGHMDGDGPSISCPTGTVTLGLGTHLEKRALPGSDAAGIWSIFKQQSGVRLLLPSLTDDSAVLLSSEFGIPILNQCASATPNAREAEHGFYECPAFEALALWTIGHPRLAAKFQDFDSYVRGWPAAARRRAKALKSAEPTGQASSGS